MRLRESLRSLLLVGLCLSAPAIAATSLNFHLDDRLPKLLDANAPAAERQAAFDACKKDALAGDIAAQYFVGNLYRLGNQLSGNIVGRDTDQAFRYLSTAGAHGFIIAMAKTAELELELKKPYEAMLWAQLYGHYEGYGDAKVNEANHRSRVGGYYAGLLRRAYAAFGSDAVQTRAMQSDYQAFVDQHDADIRAGMALGRDARAAVEPGKAPRAPQKLNLSSVKLGTPRHAQDTLCEFVLGFDAQGKTKEVLLFDCTPDLGIAAEARDALRRVEAEPASDGNDALRHAWVPFNLQGFGTERIMRR